jgi:hypothetical protein
MSDARNEFVRATFTLSKSDLRAWENFVVAYTNYTQYELERALGVPLSEAQMALGMCRRMIELRNDFRDIQTTMQKIGK